MKNDKQQKIIAQYMDFFGEIVEEEIVINNPLDDYAITYEVYGKQTVIIAPPSPVGPVR